MSGQLLPVGQRRYRKSIPDSHRQSLDTRIVWLWNQKFGTVQTIWQNSTDVLDKTACTLFLQAIMAKDLDSISQIFQRLEGGAINDEKLREQSEQQIRL